MRNGTKQSCASGTNVPPGRCAFSRIEAVSSGRLALAETPYRYKNIVRANGDLAGGFSTENTVQAQPQPMTKPQMNTEQLSRNQKKSHRRRVRMLPGSARILHLACSVNRETVSTLEACAPREASAFSGLCGEVRSSGFSLLRAQGSLKAELQTWHK